MYITSCFPTLMFNNHFTAQSVPWAPSAAPCSQPHFGLFWVILCHQQNLLLHYSPHFPRSLCHWSLSEPADTSLCCDHCQLILPLCSSPLTSYQPVGEISHYSVRTEFLWSLAEESFSKPFANTSARYRSAHHFLSHWCCHRCLWSHYKNCISFSHTCLSDHKFYLLFLLIYLMPKSNPVTSVVQSVQGSFSRLT